MGYIILGVIGLVVLSLMFSRFVRAFPRLAYFIYRFSGFISIALIMFIGFKFYSAHDAQKTVMIGGLSYSFMIIYFIWLAKITNIIRQSQNKNWWMLFLKLQFGVLRLIVFPMGLLASAFQAWFNEEKIQNR